MHYIASCSFGKDSLAMLLRLIEENKPLDEVVFYDTGMEFECIYKIRDKMLPILKEKNIKYTELKPIEKYCKDCYEYVGIAYDEPQRLNKERKGNKLFPLANWKMTEEECLQ